VIVRPLAQHPEFVTTVAGWLFSQFGHLNPGASLERSIRRVTARLQTAGCPVAMIAVDGDKPIGTASLIENDFDESSDLTPWLASVYVRPSVRRSGVGSELVNAVAADAKTAGYDRIYLFTPDMQRFFRTLGWRERQLVARHGVNVAVMELAL
jgi:predicted N-acetyltransferase YhbS